MGIKLKLIVGNCIDIFCSWCFEFVMLGVLLVLLVELFWFLGRENIKMLNIGLEVVVNGKKVIVDNKFMWDCIL